MYRQYNDTFNDMYLIFQNVNNYYVNYLLYVLLCRLTVDYVKKNKYM